MKLPVIHIPHEPSRDDLIRLFHRTQLHWNRHLGEETSLDIGTAIVNPALADVPAANCVLDAAVPEGMSPEDAVRQADTFFSQQQSRCRMWTLNPGVSSAQNGALKSALLAGGYCECSVDVLHLPARPYVPANETPGLTIIPARAGFRHARRLAEEFAAERGNPLLADAAMLHLDDPHVDALLALKNGEPLASVSVLAVGDLGAIHDLYVSSAARGQGIGRTMLSRAMEICARSLFKHVFIGRSGAVDGTMLNQMRFTQIGVYNTLVRAQKI